MTLSMTPEAVNECYERIRDQLKNTIVGQDEIVRLLLVSLFSRGHCLLIGVPGLAKTLLVRSLSEVIGLQFNRIQFTPDLMPADILGSELLKDRMGELTFEYQRGPVFTNLLLADEINRTPPKTQSALLESMQEQRVTIGGKSYTLPDPFLVVATQNPIEQEGTYPLPEAQLDRFMFSLYLDYPNREEEREIVRRTTIGQLPKLQTVVSREEILGVQELVREVPVSDHVIDYAVSLSAATRPKQADGSALSKDFIEWGAGPRASQYLILGAKTLALLDARTTPETKDVREVACAVLQHRVVPNYRATGEGLNAHEIVSRLVGSVREASYEAAARP